MCERSSVEIFKDRVLEIWKFEPCKKERKIKTKTVKTLVLTVDVMGPQGGKQS